MRNRTRTAPPARPLPPADQVAFTFAGQNEPVRLGSIVASLQALGTPMAEVYLDAISRLFVHGGRYSFEEIDIYSGAHAYAARIAKERAAAAELGAAQGT